MYTLLIKDLSGGELKFNHDTLDSMIKDRDLWAKKEPMWYRAMYYYSDSKVYIITATELIEWRE